MEIAEQKVTTTVLATAVSNKYDVAADDVTISDLTFRTGSKRGDGFCCDIAAVSFKATFNGDQHEENYIAKYTPDGPRAELLKQMLTFEQEGFIYMDFVPALQKLREAKGLKPLSFPRCYYSSPDDCLILMENLKVQGFEVVEKKPEPLSLSGVKLVLKEIAAFHASGVFLMKTYPGGMEGLIKDMPKVFDEELAKNAFDDKMMDQWLEMTSGMFHSCVLVCNKYGSEELSSKMRSFESRVAPLMKSFFTEAMSTGIKLVTHGDAWYNNFLFRYNGDKENPKDVAIVDMQMTRLGRLGMDLAYFFCSSSSPAQRKDHLDELLQFYYETFVENLQGLGYDSEPFLTFEEMKTEFDACYVFGFIMGCGHAQVLLVNENSKSNFDIDALSDPEAKTRMIQNMETELLEKAAASPYFRETVLGLCQEALERHVI